MGYACMFVCYHKISYLYIVHAKNNNNNISGIESFIYFHVDKRNEHK